MADSIVEVISKLGIDASEVYAELDRVNAQYKKSGDELRKVEKELDALMLREQKLLIARQQANNPVILTKYNKALDDTRAKIEVQQTLIAQLTETHKKLGTEATSAQAKVSQALTATADNSKRAQAIALAGAFGIGLGLTQVVSGVKQFINESVELSAKAEGISTAFSRIGGEETMNKLRVATRGATSDLELMQAALRGRNFNISTDLLAKGLEFAGKVARQTGQDVSYLSNSFVDGLGRKSIRILDNLQISQVELQKEIKKTGDFNEAVGNLIDRKLVEMGTVLDTTADKLARYTSFWENLKKTLGDELIETLSNVESFIDAIGNKMTFADVANRGGLQILKKQFEKTNGEILDQAKVSEEKRLLLLSQSSDRIVAFNKHIQKELTNEEFLGTKARLQNERVLNQLLRDLNKKTIEELTDEDRKRIEKEIEYLHKLSDELRKVQSIGRIARFEDDLQGIEKINARAKEFSEQLTLDFVNRQEIIDKEIKNEKRRAEATVLLKHIERTHLANIDQQRLREIKAFQQKELEARIENSKAIQLAELDIAKALTTLTIDDTDARIANLVDYGARKIKLLQEQGKSEEEILKFTAENALAIENLRKNQLVTRQKLNEDLFSEDQRHTLAMTDLLSAHLAERERLVQKSAIFRLSQELAFEKQRLTDLEKHHSDETLEIEKQHNKVLELEQQLTNEIRKTSKERLILELTDIATVTSAFIDAAERIIAVKIKETDALIANQEKRVSEAERLADKGNTQLLQLEKKRLDDLTKEKEKFVRDQQALAAVQLIAESAVAIAKAAAEGGAAAAVTIAVTVAALIAGLAEARQIASQAAFYHGGYDDGTQGYTGDGVPTAESRRLGKKPYIYHSEEYIFNRKTTKKYLPIFRAVHEGKMDLNETVRKANLYDSMDTRRDVVYRNLPQNNYEFQGLKDEVSEMKRAFLERPDPYFVFDEKGLQMISTRYLQRESRIKALTK